MGALLTACEDGSEFIWLSFSSLYFLGIGVCLQGLSWFSLVRFFGFAVSYLWVLFGFLLVFIYLFKNFFMVAIVH